jgi:hypothetical protein
MFNVVSRASKHLPMQLYIFQPEVISFQLLHTWRMSATVLLPQNSSLKLVSCLTRLTIHSNPFAGNLRLPPPPSPLKSRHVGETAGSRLITSQSSVSSMVSPPSSHHVTLVFQHIRSLSGITSSLEIRPAIPLEDETIPALGPAANRYLSDHGYNISALHHIEHARSTSRNIQEFVGYLHPRGMPWREIEYLWHLIYEQDA